ncbi:hypothetical protein ABZS66_59385 [Dactylosporangium sp. NPDC005572]|uniref:hypothetical protein n=1 Tax=Dactylosporangium sp. NPDC005572 TaxID=3156889 RepID=UPI0033BD6542
MAHVTTSDSAVECFATLAVPVAVDAVWELLHDEAVLAKILAGDGPLPPVTGVTDIDGAWARAGDSRSIEFADGSGAHEELVLDERPTQVRYRITGFTSKALAATLSQVDGAFLLTHDGCTTTLNWRYTLHPSPGTSLSALAAAGRQSWLPYMGRILDAINVELLDR